MPTLLLERAVRLSGAEALALLRRRFGPAVDLGLHPDHADPCASPEGLPAELWSPVIDRQDGTWLKRANRVGVNVRTVGSFWNLTPEFYSVELADLKLRTVGTLPADVDRGTLYEELPELATAFGDRDPSSSLEDLRS